MKPKHLFVLSFCIISSIFMSGCVVGRRTVSLMVPDLPAGTATETSVSINTPTDERGFENKPSQPSTPSIDGDVNTLTEEQKVQMIGRQRNGYGAAMGDVALPEGDTVVTKMKQLVVEGLEARGHSIASEGGDYELDVQIDEFWGWFTPGMFTVSFEARIKSEITLSDGSEEKTFVVRGYGINRGQVASDANWQLAYSRAFEDFLKNLDTELESQGL